MDIKHIVSNDLSNLTASVPAGLYELDCLTDSKALFKSNDGQYYACVLDYTKSTKEYRVQLYELTLDELYDDIDIDFETECDMQNAFLLYESFPGRFIDHDRAYSYFLTILTIIMLLDFTSTSLMTQYLTGYHIREQIISVPDIKPNQIN